SDGLGADRRGPEGNRSDEVSSMSCRCGIGQAPDWLMPLIGAIQGEAMAPRDTRVKSLWDLLRQRGLLNRSRWLPKVLHRIWRHGLAARPRPRTTQRLTRLLIRWGILPASAAPAVVVSQTVVAPQVPRPFRRVIVHPVRVRPVRPVRVSAAGRRFAR